MFDILRKIFIRDSEDVEKPKNINNKEWLKKEYIREKSEGGITTKLKVTNGFMDSVRWNSFMAGVGLAGFLFLCVLSFFIFNLQNKIIYKTVCHSLIPQKYMYIKTLANKCVFANDTDIIITRIEYNPVTLRYFLVDSD